MWFLDPPLSPPSALAPSVFSATSGDAGGKRGAAGGPVPNIALERTGHSVVFSQCVRQCLWPAAHRER